MKLLLCKECGDIFNLSMKGKECSCGWTFGQYTDNLNAVYEGHCIPLCISNPSLRNALEAQNINDIMFSEKFHGARFEAWVCPRNSETFKEVKR